MTRNVSFYNGGFQARYGDKMSSVLDIQYKKPKQFGGSAYAGLLEQGLHLEGITKNNKFTYLIGVRNRSMRNLFKSQETQGNYVPSSNDLQALFTYQINAKNSIELLGNISQTKFTLVPEFSQLTSSVFSPYFSANLGMDIYFSGPGRRQVLHQHGGVVIYTATQKEPAGLKWMLSRFENDEREGIDITGAYLFGEREFDKPKPISG